MKRLYITCGIPGSGKSTWAAQKCTQGWSWNSRDRIRFSIITNEDDYFAYEDKVYDTFVSNIQNDINDGIENIIADATHLNERARKQLLNRISLLGYEVIYVYFDVSLDTAIERNNKREGRIKVPETVIKKMYNSLTFPEGKVIVINEKGEEII
jgi:predicted kinase